MGFWGGWGVGSDFAFHLLQKEKGGGEPLRFFYEINKSQNNAFLFFLHTLLLIGMTDVMPRFRWKCLQKQFASLQGTPVLEAAGSGARGIPELECLVASGRRAWTARAGSASGSPAEGAPTRSAQTGVWSPPHSGSRVRYVRAPTISRRDPSTVQVVSYAWSLVTPTYLMQASLKLC